MADLVRLPFEQPSPLHPSPVQQQLQASGPVHEVRTRTDHAAWLVTDHAQVRRLLADDRLGRSHPDPASASRTGESALFGGPVGNHDTEHVDHQRMRSLLQPHFSPWRMRALTPRIESLVEELLDQLDATAPPADLIEAVATPLPILVICEILGIPYGDRARFRAWSRATADVRDRARSQQGLADLYAYGHELVSRKRRDPGDDVISRLAATDGVDDDEIARMAMALLFAGHETTVVQIGLGALLLLTHPDQHQLLADDPDAVRNAVEEILRTPGKPSGGIPRYARVELRIGDVRVAAGDLVLLDTGAANHDPDVFDDPARFDITRREAGSHLSFGHGPRYCVGAPLARLELRVVVSQLSRRFPTMRLAVPVEDLEVHQGQLTGGLVALPVAW